MLHRLRKSILAFCLPSFLVLACNVHPPTPAPPTTVTETVRVSPEDSSAGIRAARVYWDGSAETLGATDDFGRAFLLLRSNEVGNLCAAREGFLVKCERLVVASQRDITITLARVAPPPPAAEPWTTVTQAQVLAVRADLIGSRLPEFAPRCPEDPSTGIRCVGSSGRVAEGLKAGYLFTTHYGNYPQATRLQWLADYKAQGLTHFVINISDAPGKRGYDQIYPATPSTAANINIWLKEIWHAGLIPMCIGIGVDDVDTFDAARALAASLDDIRLCPWIIPGMELNDDLHTEQEINNRIDHARAAFPHAEMGVEFTPQHSSGGEDEPGWWAFALARWGAHFLYQDNNWDDVQKSLDNAGDLVIRMGGNGDPANGGYKGWPRGFRVYWFESDVFPRFWFNRSPAEASRYNGAIVTARMDTLFCYNGFCGKLAGYGSGR